MEVERFDAIVKALSTGASRRRALTAALLGGLLARASFEGAHDAAAKNKNNKKKCKNGKKRCGKYCIGKDRCCTSKDCPGCHSCSKHGSCEPDPIPLTCGACETVQCVANLFFGCVYAPNCPTPFGGECCVPPETHCCPQTDGTTACLKPHKDCGDCMYRCPETGTLCCSTSQFCGNVGGQAKCL